MALRLHPGLRWFLGFALLAALIVWVQLSVGWADVLGAWRNFPAADLAMVVGLTLTFAYIVYFKFVAPGDNNAANWWFGISPEGIGMVGALANFATAAIVSRFASPAPDDVQQLVENIRIPRGAETPQTH